MNQDIGKQCDKDYRTDRSGFLARARWHQSAFRARKLAVPFDDYGNYLQQADAEKGFNFYDDFDIFKAVKDRYPNYSKPLYANMLRSEHIPFNLFIPFMTDYKYAVNVFNVMLNGTIGSIDRIKIEYAPSPSSKYLNDRTSFDACIWYTHVNGKKGVIGVEVKYTEHDYPLKAGSTEEGKIEDRQSIYYKTALHCGLFDPEHFNKLASDRFRQIWRNQLLGERMLIVDPEKYNHFHSLTIYPEGNLHFVEASKDYLQLLISNNLKFLPVTYESFLQACQRFLPDQRFQKWIDYLRERYIVDQLSDD